MRVKGGYYTFALARLWPRGSRPSCNISLIHRLWGPERVSFFNWSSGIKHSAAAVDLICPGILHMSSVIWELPIPLFLVAMGSCPFRFTCLVERPIVFRVGNSRIPARRWLRASTRHSKRRPPLSTQARLQISFVILGEIFRGKRSGFLFLALQ